MIEILAKIFKAVLLRVADGKLTVDEAVEILLILFPEDSER